MSQEKVKEEEMDTSSISQTESKEGKPVVLLSSVKDIAGLQQVTLSFIFSNILFSFKVYQVSGLMHRVFVCTIYLMFILSVFRKYMNWEDLLPKFVEKQPI